MEGDNPVTADTRSHLPSDAGPRVSARVRREWVARRVRELYEQDLAEPLPDHILALLHQHRPDVFQHGSEIAAAAAPIRDNRDR